MRDEEPYEEREDRREPDWFTGGREMIDEDGTPILLPSPEERIHDAIEGATKELKDEIDRLRGDIRKWRILALVSSIGAFALGQILPRILPLLGVG